MREKKYRTLSVESDVYDALNRYRQFHGKTFADSIWQLLGQPERPVKKGFGKREYPFHSLEVGESCVIPWLAEIGRENAHINGRITGALYQYEYRTGKKFERHAVSVGLTVTRTA